LGKEESREDVKGSYPVYTRPAVFEAKVKGKKKKMEVPEVLQRGNHAEIKKWRRGGIDF
jgi:tRNA (guanine-N1)-methyltransferase